MNTDSAIRALGRFVSVSLAIGAALYLGAACALFLLIALFTQALAAENCVWGGLTVGSHHFDRGRERDYEQQNWGPHGEVCLGREDLRAFGGWDRNSKRRDSVYIGGVWGPLQAGPVRAGVAIGRVSGYGTAEPNGHGGAEVDDEPTWALFPVLALEGRRLGANLMYFPRTGRNVAVLAWQLKWRFR